MRGSIYQRRAAGTILVVSMMLSGCMGTGTDSGSGGFSTAALFGAGQKPALTPAEQRLREDANMFNKTVLGGVAYNAAMGAILGGVVGLLQSRGDLKKMITYVAVGAG